VIQQETGPYRPAALKHTRSQLPARFHPGSLSHKRTQLALLLLATFGLFIVGCGSDNSPSTQTITLPVKTLTVSGEPELTITNHVGIIHVHSGNADNVIVRAELHADTDGGSLDDMQVNTAQHGNAITITTSNQKPDDWLATHREEIDLDITMPVSGNLNITSLQGFITIDGISGQMNIQTTTSLIAITHATLKGQSSFKSNAGPLSYNGMLDPQSTTLFQTNLGPITVTLPATTSFSLVASTGKLATPTGKEDVTNDFGSTTIGSAPHAQLELHSSMGKIALHKTP